MFVILVKAEYGSIPVRENYWPFNALMLCRTWTGTVRGTREGRRGKWHYYWPAMTTSWTHSSRRESCLFPIIDWQLRTRSICETAVRHSSDRRTLDGAVPQRLVPRAKPHVPLSSCGPEANSGTFKQVGAPYVGEYPPTMALLISTNVLSSQDGLAWYQATAPTCHLCGNDHRFPHIRRNGEACLPVAPVIPCQSSALPYRSVQLLSLDPML